MDDFKIFPLIPGTKRPATLRGHLDAKDATEWDHSFQDYGIALDGQFIVVDIDNPSKVSEDLLEKLGQSSTWQQKTKRGRHFLYRVPEGFSGTNARLPNGAGDIKVNGYIVGPGSTVDGFTYEIVAPFTGVSVAPQWLPKLVGKAKTSVVGTVSDECGIVFAEGEGRNQFLVKEAGYFRGQGLNVEQTKSMVRTMNDLICKPPIPESELRNTIDKSIAKWEQGATDDLVGTIQPDTVLQASAVEIVREPIDYMLRPLLPRVGLTLMHGKGGVGKSTFASFATAQATKKELRVLLLCTEEDPILHVQRALHMGADADYIYWPDPKKVRVNSIKFPKDAEKLEELIEELGIGFLYIDGIKTHADAKVTANMHDGDKSRKLVEDIAAIAIKHEIVILATFHNNKGTDTAMGSEELANTARQQLSLTSSGKDEAKRLSIKVDKSNGPDGGKIVQFSWHAKEFQDPLSGKFQQEIIEDDIDADDYDESTSVTVKAQVPYLEVVRRSEQSAAEQSYATPVRDKTTQSVLDILSHGDWMYSSVVKSKVVEETEASLDSVRQSIGILVSEGKIKTEGKSQNTRYKLIPTLSI